MAVEPQPDASPPHGHRGPWPWICLVLAVLAVGLLVWGIKTRSDLDTANQKNDELQAQVEQNANKSDTASAAIKTAYSALAQQLGTTNADVAAIEQQVKGAADAGAQAAKDAAASAQSEVNAKSDAAKAKAK